MQKYFLFFFEKSYCLFGFLCYNNRREGDEPMINKEEMKMEFTYTATIKQNVAEIALITICNNPGMVIVNSETDEKESRDFSNFEL